MNTEVTKIRSNGHVFAVTEGMVYPLTPCCEASGKGSNVESGVVCRSCYVEVASYYGGFARNRNEFVYMTYDVLIDFVAEAVWDSLIKL